MMTDKLKRLEENLRILSNFKKKYTLEDVIADKVEGLFIIDENFTFLKNPPAPFEAEVIFTRLTSQNLNSEQAFLLRLMSRQQ